jgi:hypothetical protein
MTGFHIQYPRLDSGHSLSPAGLPLRVPASPVRENAPSANLSGEPRAIPTSPRLKAKHVTPFSLLGRGGSFNNHEDGRWVMRVGVMMMMMMMMMMADDDDRDDEGNDNDDDHDDDEMPHSLTPPRHVSHNSPKAGTSGGDEEGAPPPAKKGPQRSGSLTGGFANIFAGLKPKV